MRIELLEFQDTARGYLVDLDGTLIRGTTVLPESARLLKMLRGRYLLLSNNAEHTPHQLSRLLDRMGLSIAANDILLAGTVAIDKVAAEAPSAGVLLLGSPALRAYARRRGLDLSAGRPDIVMVMRDRQFTYGKLARAAAALSDGARLVVAAPDGSHPGADGRPVPETGALAAAILACVGHREYSVVGKPERTMFEKGCAQLGVTPAEAMMIGDNLDTDGLGARRFGMRFHQVKNGLLDLDPRRVAA